ncbi:hypothetical protein ACJMK2_007024, partial [Sinanodonta woodiana]
QPDIPRDVQIIKNRITTTSVDIEWFSGFHGGSNQTFVIEYRKQEDESWTNYSQNFFGGLMQNKYFNITVEDLHQNTLYFFQLYAWNEFGRSEYSTIINVTTFAESNKREVVDKGADEVIIGVAVGAVVFLSIIVAIVGIMLYRRRDQKPHNDGMPLEPDARSEGISNRDSGLVDNPLYETTVAEYAAVVKPKKNVVVADHSNLYAQVNNINKTKKKGEAKVKQGKMTREEAYENIDLEGKSSTANSEYEESRQTRTETFDGTIYENPGTVASYSPLVNKDGILYADLDLPTTKNRQVIIRGIENRTLYADIAYGKSGKPFTENAD